MLRVRCVLLGGAAHFSDGAVHPIDALGLFMRCSGNFSHECHDFIGAVRYLTKNTAGDIDEILNDSIGIHFHNIEVIGEVIGDR